MSTQVENLTCPFCDFVDQDPYFIMQHVELIHPENGESPFLVRDAEVADQGLGGASPARNQEIALSSGRSLLSPKPEQDTYVACPYGCGESILSSELQVHADLHVAESMAFEENGLASELQLSTGACNDRQAITDISNAFSTQLPKSLRNFDEAPPSTPPSSSKRRKTSLKDLFLGSPTQNRTPFKTVTPGKTRQLGRSELGPYAYEKQMPAWLRKMLEEGAKVTISNKITPNGTVLKVEAVANETPDLVPVLARLSDLDRSVERAFYCSPAVHHIAKMPNEGGFCGYRNIQMMISYIRNARAVGHWHFPGKTPSILRLQDMIEHAWEMGINSIGRIETGGIRLTRKYIGTPEAQALLQSLDIGCEAISFMRQPEMTTYENLLLAVGEYFGGEDAIEFNEKVVLTNKPPIYFQHRGHSMTIVGLEAMKDGSMNLVVFDPMFNPSPAIKRLVGSNSFRGDNAAKLMKAHRRGESYLTKYKDFEILTFTDPLPGSMREV